MILGSTAKFNSRQCFQLYSTSQYLMAMLPMKATEDFYIIVSHSTKCTIFSVQAVYNWQFVHCLDLWSHMLGHVTHESLRPLIYPLVQVMVGAIQLQPSARHYPLRLHIVRTLIELSQATATFVPVTPYLLEVSKVLYVRTV